MKLKHLLYQNPFYTFTVSSRYLERDSNRVEHHGGKTMRAFRSKQVHNFFN